MTNDKGIIFAADIDNKNALFRIIREVQPFVEAIKIGNIVLYEFGWGILRELKKMASKPLLVDLKLMDIPYVAKKITIKAFENGADAIMICGPVGDETIVACRSAFNGRSIFLFTEFTHLSGLISEEMADDYIDLALILGCKGIQLPGGRATRIMNIKKRVGSSLTIISCGIGAQGPKIGSAIAAGADYEIIGRSIYDPNELGATPREAAKRAHEIIFAGGNESRVATSRNYVASPCKYQNPILFNCNLS